MTKTQSTSSTYISITGEPTPNTKRLQAMKTTKRMKKNMSTPKHLTMSHRFEVTLRKYLRICSWASSVLMAVSSTLPSMRTCNVERLGSVVVSFNREYPRPQLSVRLRILQLNCGFRPNRTLFRSRKFVMTTGTIGIRYF